MTTVTTLLYDTLHPTRVHQSQQILWESQLILVKDPKTSLCGTVTTEMSIYGDESMSCSKVHLLYSVTVLDKDKYLCIMMLLINKKGSNDYLKGLNFLITFWTKSVLAHLLSLTSIYLSPLDYLFLKPYITIQQQRWINK